MPESKEHDPVDEFHFFPAWFGKQFEIHLTMVSSTSAMFESIAFHITRHESPISYESAKENAPSPAKHSIKAAARKMSKLAATPIAKELAMEQLPTSDSAIQDVVFESHVYVPQSGTTLDGHSSTDSCSAVPSRVSTTSHATDILGRTLKDAMVIDFGVMTVMCFAGSPLKRDDTFDRSVISGNEEASLITIQNKYMETPEASPRASPILLPDPKVISIKTRNSQDRARTQLSALNMPLTAMFAQHQVLTVISDEGPDDEDIELNCNVEHSTEVHHTAIQQNSVDTYPQYFSSDSKSPSVTSTLTSGSVSFIHQKIAVALGEGQNKSTLGDIVLKKNPSLTYAHGCFSSQAHTNLDSSSHGSSADGNSTASTSPSTTLMSLADNPVVKPSTWNDLFCNMNTGIQIFDFDDPDSPLALGCMSPTAVQVESQTRLDSKTSKSVDHALDCTNAKSNGGGMNWTCNEHKEPSWLCEESIGDIVKTSKTCHLNCESGVPHTPINSISAMINNNTERKTFDTILSNMERLTAFERVIGNHEVCSQDDDQDFSGEDFQPCSVQDVNSIVELATSKTEEQLSQSSESVESISFQDAGPSHDKVHDVGNSRERTFYEVMKTNDQNEDESIWLEKEEEEAIRKAYYLHRRQLYLKSHAKSNSLSDARSLDDNDSEERPFDCGPSNPTALKSDRQHDKGTKAQVFTPRSTIEGNISASASSINATYRHRKFSPRNLVTSGSPPPKPTLDEPSQPQFFDNPKMMEQSLLKEMARMPSEKNHTNPCSSDSVSSHLKIPSRPGSSEEKTSLGGSPKNTERSERTHISITTCGSAHNRQHRSNEALSSPNIGNCHQMANALRLTDPGNCNNPRLTGSQAVHSKTSFQTTIETSLTADTENRHPHHKLISPRSTSCSTIPAHKKSGTHLVIGSTGKNSQNACTGLTPEAWNMYQQKSKATLGVDSIDSQNRMRQSPENLGISSGGCLHPKSTQATSLSDSGRSSLQRTTITSLAVDSGISHRFVTSSNLGNDSGSNHLRATSFGSTHDRGSQHNKSTGLNLATESVSNSLEARTRQDSGSTHLRTTSFGSTHDRGSQYNKSTGMNLATESGTSSLESRTMQSESNSSHRRTDRLNYLKMVRGVKIASRHLQ